MSGIDNFDIRSNIIDSLIDTFDTMVSMEIESSFSEPSKSTDISRMVATVNFAGIVAGIFNIQVTSEFARLMTANMLDMEPEEIESEDEVRDLLAEIANIVGGNLKSSLNDAGHRCVLSTPCITYGADFTIKSLNMERFEQFIFKYQEDFIIVEVGLKIQQGSEDGEGVGAIDRLGQINEIDFEKINALDLHAQVSESVIDVFDTMLSLKLEKIEEDGSGALEGVRNVGSVSFAGDVAGMFSLHVEQEFSREMAAEMLGMEVEEIEGDEEIRDLLGEIGNIVGGNLKSAFTDAGLTCALSTPSFTTGSDFKIETLNMEKYERFAFRCNGKIIYAEMGVKISEFTQPMDQPSGDSHAEDLDVEVVEDESTAPQEEKAAAVKTAAIPEKQDAAQAVATPPESQPSPAKEATTSASVVSGEENDPSADPDPQSPEDGDLSLLLDIPLEIKVELGRAKIPIYELRNLAPGSAVKLVKLEGEPVDILANDTLIARGEVVVQNEKYGIRVIEITSRMERIRSFGL